MKYFLIITIYLLALVVVISDVLCAQPIEFNSKENSPIKVNQDFEPFTDIAPAPYPHKRYFYIGSQDFGLGVNKNYQSEEESDSEERSIVTYIVLNFQGYVFIEIPYEPKIVFIAFFVFLLFLVLMFLIKFNVPYMKLNLSKRKI